jgi:FkbM family methyltransferase
MIRKLIRLSLLAAIAAITAMTLLAFWGGPPPMAVGLMLVGRSSCPPSETLRVVGDNRRLAASRDRIQREVRKIAADGDLDLWDVPGSGRFWTRGPFQRPNALVFAEMQSGIYFHGDVRVRGGDIVLDCGAEYGTFTRRALDAGAAKVLAIEIDPLKRECLRRTFAKEISEGRVVLVTRGVWDRDDVLELSVDTVVLAREGKRQTVKVTTIDQIVSEAGLERVDFMKFDIEGAERQALQGARETLKHFKPSLAITAEHFADDYREIPRVVRGIVPEYTVTCGHCVFSAAGLIVPEILYFRDASH